MPWVRKITRKDGKVRWRAEYRDPKGQVRSGGTFATEGAAKRAARDQEVAKDEGTWTDPALGKVRGADWFARFLEASPHLRPSTVDVYTRLWHGHLESTFGHRSLRSVTPLDVSAWAAREQAAGTGPATINAAYRVGRRVWGAAVAANVLARNPFVGVKVPSPGTEEQRFLTHQELIRIAAEVPDRDRALVLLLGLAGLRIDEALALRVEDLDLLRRRVTVNKAASEVRGKVSIGPTKTGKARAVPLPAVVVEALEAHLAAFPAAPDRLLFPDRDGGAMRRTNWRRRVWVPAVRRSGIADPLPRVHDLRHTAASLAIQAGAHPRALMEMLGHSSITVTLDRYGHLLPGLADQLAERMDAAYRDAEAGRTGVR